MPSNYCPMSLTAIPSAIIESIVKGKAMEHLTAIGFPSNSYHGLRARWSCGTQLLEMINEGSNMTELRYPVDTICLNFQKTFDSVPHP